MEKLNDIYLELLDWLQYEGKPSLRIWHPVFYSYPWGLRFELGVYELDDTLEYVQSAKDRGRRIWDAVFAPEDEVLVVFDTTPDRTLKQELKTCSLQRIRAQRTCPIPGEDDPDDEPTYFDRHLYRAAAKESPFDAILKRIVEERTLVGGLWRYGSAVYFYNRTTKLLFHPYDDRGADLLGPDRESLRSYYNSLNDLLLDYNREDMDRKFHARTVFLRVLTTTTDPEAVARVRELLKQKLRGAEVFCEHFEPYWKTEGWGEMNLTIASTRPLKDIQYRLASKWESDTASGQIHSEIFLPDVGFLWVSE